MTWHSVDLGRGKIFQVTYFKDDCRMLQCQDDDKFTVRPIAPRPNSVQWTTLCALKKQNEVYLIGGRVYGP